MVIQRRTTSKLGDASTKAAQNRSSTTMKRRKKKSSSSAPQPPRSPAAMFFWGVLFVLLGLWLLIPLIIKHHGPKLRRVGDDSSGRATGEGGQTKVDHENAAHKARPKHAMNHPAAAESTTSFDGYIHHPPVKKKESEVIDMRQKVREMKFDNPDGGAWKQGWDVVAPPLDPKNPLQVFVIPHSHCDPGWIKTFDEYFQNQVKQIITTVVNSLAKDERRKFIWAEISYLSWWWDEQTPDTRNLVKKLLRNKQLEIVTGGWVQTDEANTQLYAMEVQLQEGHEWIRQELGEEFVPRYAWSIDPFGYSPTMAYLQQKYGFDGMVIQRVHYAVKKELALHKQLEFMWRQTWDATGAHDIFTHIMPFFSYDVPHTCGPDPSVCCQFDFARNSGGCPWRRDPQTITHKNVKERSMLLLDQYQKKASLYRSGNVVLIPLGDDFRWMTEHEATAQYSNYQKIMDYVNEHVEGATIQWGTLSDYFNAVMGQPDFEVPILKGSFFTYSDVNQDYWSGYFTSRIFDKALDRQLERALVAAESLGAKPMDVREGRRALSLFQHHDGVTGTARDHVVVDYAKRIHSAIHATQEWIWNKLDTDTGDEDYKACWQSDAPRGLSQNLCEGSKEVVLYNPLSTSQYCGALEVHGKSHATSTTYPCDDEPSQKSSSKLEFDPTTGMLISPIKEEWMVWSVTQGGAYLFFPGHLDAYKGGEIPDDSSHDAFHVEDGGFTLRTKHWTRKLVVREVPDEFDHNGSSMVLDFIFETFLQNGNEEWLARFTSPKIHNEGVFHTDLNGFNFDTHHFRADMPIQSQVFPMPTLASIEDSSMRMTVMSEHAQGTASLENGKIDVWLDRRLTRDDSRGLGQGVQDNVPTRTRLRVLLEADGGYAAVDDSFEPTKLCRRMWEELNNPLVAFGQHAFATADEVRVQHGGGTGKAKTGQLRHHNEGFNDFRKGMLAGAGGEGVGGGKKQAHMKALPRPPNHKLIHEGVGSLERNMAQVSDKYPIVPIVYMVYKRVDYLKQSIDSIRKSDIDTSKVPIIISMDGHIDEMMAYVDELKNEFPLLQSVIHPYACHDHPNEFPGDVDAELNKGYGGDTYRNPRTWQTTCCKHHFAWLFRTAFEMELPVQAEAFLFMEEDYILASNVYENIQRGLYLTDHGPDADQIFAVTLDPTDGANRAERVELEDAWFVRAFTTGPMVVSRKMYTKFKAGAKDFCEYDDYNWDWSFVKLMNLEYLPRYVVCPTRTLAKHIGLDEGLHSMNLKKKQRAQSMKIAENFVAEHYYRLAADDTPTRNPKPYGGWGHPRDQQHCKDVLGVGAHPQ